MLPNAVLASVVTLTLVACLIPTLANAVSTTASLPVGAAASARALTAGGAATNWFGIADDP